MLPITTAHQPTIHWDDYELDATIGFLKIVNPGTICTHNMIKEHATKYLTQVKHSVQVPVEGCYISLFLNHNDSGYDIDFEYYAKVSINPLLARNYMEQREDKYKKIICYQDDERIDCTTLQEEVT